MSDETKPSSDVPAPEKPADPAASPKPAEPAKSADAKPSTDAKPAATDAKPADADAKPADPAKLIETQPEVRLADVVGDPKPGIQLTLHGQTDVGLVREHNEDNFVVVDLTTGTRVIGVGAEAGPVPEALSKHPVGARGTVFAVCDGMGGAAAGEVASRMAVDTIHEVMTSGRVPLDRDDFARRLVRSIEEAGSRIFTAAKLDRTRRGMGTTSTVAGLVDKTLFVGQVGDSRAYLLRGAEFKNITKDQSLVRQLIDAGQLTEEEADAFEHSNIILQALGTAEQVTVDLTFLELRRGDRLMLCSDGLSGLVHADMIKDVMATVRDQRACCATLIEMARTGGGHDNITVIVVDFDGADLPPPGDGYPVAYQQYPLPAATERDPSLAPRDPSMKAGGPKPGHDVKGERVAVAGGERGGMPTGLLVLGIVLLAVLAIGAMVMFGGNTEEPQLPLHDEPTAIVDHVAPPVATFPVRIRSEGVAGELFVDGERKTTIGELPVTLQLPTGVYTFVVRAGDVSVTDPMRVVVGEAGADVDLTIPNGRVTAPEDAGAAAASDAGAGSAPPVRDAGAPRRDAGTTIAVRPDAGATLAARPDAGAPRPRPDAGTPTPRPDAGAPRPRPDAGSAPRPRPDAGHVATDVPVNGIAPNPF